MVYFPPKKWRKARKTRETHPQPVDNHVDKSFLGKRCQMAVIEIELTDLWGRVIDVVSADAPQHRVVKATIEFRVLLSGSDLLQPASQYFHLLQCAHQ